MVLDMQVEFTSKATSVELWERESIWEELRWKEERRAKKGNQDSSGTEGRGGSDKPRQKLSS